MSEQVTLFELMEKRESQIVKANELITKSRFSLTAQQQKIVLYLISQLNPYDDDFKLYEFDIRDFCMVCGIDIEGGRMYDFLKTQIKSISDRSLWVTLENGEETLLRWIEKPYIDKKSGKVRIKFDNDMKPYLLQLNQKFTQYALYNTLLLKSKYSIRLYEFLKSLHFDKFKPYEYIITVEELRVRIGAEVYTDYKFFHRRALKPAVSEINENTDLYLEYEQIKNGKKVEKIKFNFKTKDVIEYLKQSEQGHKELNSRVSEGVIVDDKR